MRAFAVGALAFATSFLLRWIALAPGLTFEDSGELAAAAYTLGVAHSPGYPLFTLAGKLFTLLPFGNVAWRLNLMSALAASLAAAFLSGAVLRILRERTAVALGSALGGALLLATSLEVWEQSVITEVYALNLLVVACFLFVLSGRECSPERSLLAASFVAGLATTTHATSLILLPPLVLLLLRTRAWIGAVACFSAGLLPILYLPIASRFDPAWDWADPQGVSGLWQTLTQNFGRVDAPWSAAGTLAQLRLGAELLGHQWLLPLLLLAVPGLVALRRRDRGLFAAVLLFLPLAGPGVTLATNIDVAGSSPAQVENAAQVSVYYIPLYLGLALLAGLGVEHVARRAFHERPRAQVALAAGVVLLCLGASLRTYRSVDMSDYHFAEDYVHNVSSVLEPGALYFVGWDSFYFPLVYGALVEKRRPDLVVLDVQMLRSSWYVRAERRRHPEPFRAAGQEVEAFLREVAPFEAGEAHDPLRIQAAHDGMIRALVDRSIDAGRGVYFAHRPPPAIAAEYSVEPVVVARKLTRSPRALGPLPLDELRFRGYGDGRGRQDRWAVTFGRHYGTLLFERASRVEQGPDLDLAERLYGQALACLPPDDPLRERARAALERVRSGYPEGAAGAAGEGS